MKNRKITTSIFAASVGLAFMAGIPAAGAAPENGNPCPSGTLYQQFQTGETRTVVTAPAHTIHREVSPAVPAVTRVEFEFAHSKNHKLEPRWEAEGWNAEGNPKSTGWVATGQTRIIIVTPAIDAVFETVHVPEATVQVPVLGFSCLAEGRTAAEGALTQEAPPAENVTTGAGSDAPIGVAVGSTASPAQQAGGAVRSDAPGIEAGGPEHEMATARTAMAADLASTGAGKTSAVLITGALALGGGAALFGAAKLRRRRAAL